MCVRIFTFHTEKYFLSFYTDVNLIQFITFQRERQLLNWSFFPILLTDYVKQWHEREIFLG